MDLLKVDFKFKYHEILRLFIKLSFTFSLFWLASCNKNINKKYIILNNTTFEVELAKTEKEKLKGLMNRTKLAKNSGMLLIYEQPQYLEFWMKNTLIPLRIIWIDEYDIVQGFTDALPCKHDPCELYKSPIPVSKILEINPQDLEPEIGKKIKF